MAFARYSATIEWIAPTAYEDGTPLAPEEILSFEIMYGTESGNYTSSVTVSGDAREFTVSNLASGTWYFVATVTTVELETSVISNEVSRKFTRGKPKKLTVRLK
jgi:hypothetical protein